MNSNESLTDSQIVGYMQEKMREEGMLDKIRIQVRKEIVDQLLTKDSKPKKKYKTFEYKVGDCLVENFIKIRKYNCTHDIYSQECSLDSSDYLGTQELLQLHGLTLRDYEEFAYRLGEDNISALEIMVQVLKRRYHIEKQDHSCQTENGEESYEQKMRNLESRYLKKIDYSRLNDMQTIEDRMNVYKKDIEKRCKAQFDAELARMRDWEIAGMKADEQRRYQEKLRQLQNGGDTDFHQKLQELKKKENEALERLNLRTKELERNMFEKKQELQKQIDEIEQEKIKMHRHKCLESDVVKKELEELEGVKCELRKAIQEYKNSREILDRQAEKQIADAQQFWKDKLKNEKENSMNGQKQDQDWVQYQKDSCQRLQNQREYLKSENEQLRTEIVDLQYKFKEIEKELDSCRNELNRAKDERDIEHNYCLRLQGQLDLVNNIRNGQ